MSNFVKPVLLASLATLAFSAAPASALTITLNDLGGAGPTTEAGRDFRFAAHYWESVLQTNAHVKLDVSFAPLPANVIGGTSTPYFAFPVWLTEATINARAKNATAKLAASNLPTLDGNRAISLITPGYQDPANHLGIDTTTRVWDSDGSPNNRFTLATLANGRALLGYNGPLPYSDATIRFNSTLPFDFNPSDGITPGSSNFLAAAIHEIGHALGFVSGVDDYDIYGAPNGPFRFVDQNGNLDDPNNALWVTPLDLFRYSSNPEGLGGTGPQIDQSIRNPDLPNFAQPYFSIDGGKTALFDNLLSRGFFNGKSYQASHWRSHSIAGQPYLGIMDPVEQADPYVSALDLAAFDAIGWNTKVDPLSNPDYHYTVADIYAAQVPEGQVWPLIVLLGMGGAMLRQRSR